MSICISSDRRATGIECRREAIVTFDHGSRQLLRARMFPRCDLRQGIRSMNDSKAARSEVLVMRISVLSAASRGT